MTYDLRDWVIAVTGGGGDIGGAICERLDASGACVIVLDADAAGGRKAAAALKHSQSQFLPLDVSGSTAVRETFERIGRQYGRLDGLVNGAGIAPLAAAIDTGDETWNRTIAINLSGVHYCSREAARIMLQQNKGAIVNISSTNGLVGEEMLTAYNASKFGVMGITKTMALELGERGIRVNAVNPGLIETKLTAPARSDPEWVRAYQAKIPLRRFGLPREVASCVAFLLSDEASFVTGTGLLIDGGQICH